MSTVDMEARAGLAVAYTAAIGALVGVIALGLGFAPWPGLIVGAAMAFFHAYSRLAPTRKNPGIGE